jgi:hypothetical protein
MSVRSDVLLWAQRVLARKSGPAHLLLEVKANCTAEQAQEAFHKIARVSHPDLHRQGLDADELELVTSAYAAVAGAYMQLRSQTGRPIRADETPTPRAPVGRPTPIPAASSPARDESGGNFTDFVAGLASANAAELMTPKALVYFRKAEAGMRRGDLKSALLQIKLAIAADPTSTFLRNALGEVDAELRRTT